MSCLPHRSVASLWTTPMRRFVRVTSKTGMKWEPRHHCFVGAAGHASMPPMAHPRLLSTGLRLGFPFQEKSKYV